MDLNIYCDYKENFNHCDTRDFEIKHPIKNIMFDHIDWLRNLDNAGKLRPCVLLNIEKMLLCKTVYLGYDRFECPYCGNESIAPHSCHSRFCNACGVKYAKQLAAKATSFCLDVHHRHIIFTISDKLWGWFRQDRSRLNLLFIAARNTICAIVNNNLYKKAKRRGLKNTRYLYRNYRHSSHFGMISTIHTFGRDLKWNPHIHALVPELIYNPDKDMVKTFHHFDFKKLKSTFMYELLRLIEEVVGPSFKKDKNLLYTKYKNGFYVYARTMTTDKEHSSNTNTKNINACITYAMRYVGRPAMAESRIIKYSKDEDTIVWFYHDHKDEVKHIVKEDSKSFIKKLLIHIPDENFRSVRYYGFYSNKAGEELDHIHELLGNIKSRNYSKETRKKKREKMLNKLKYRTHLIDSFNRDPLKCRCGHYLEYKETYSPLEGVTDERLYRKKCIDEMQALRIRRRCPTVGS